jgi:hypothetical protein
VTARTTFESSVASAGAAKTATLASNVAQLQATISAAGVDQGKNPQLGCDNALTAAIKAAAAAKQNADAAAEASRQSSISAAREALRATGDLGPV